MSRLNICGDKGTYVPSQEICDSCEVLENRVETLEAFKDDAESTLSVLNSCCETVQSDITSLSSAEDAMNNRLDMLNNSLDNKQDTLQAGLNIQINGNVISATTTDPLDFVYPVGSIYMSVNPTSPASLFGGTWQQIEDRFLLSAGSTYTAGTTGGSATHTLTAGESGRPSATINTDTVQMSHSHGTSSSRTDDGFMIVQGNTTGISEARVAHASSGDRVVPAQTYNTTVDYAKVTNTDTVVQGHNHTVTISGASASSAHNNMPPYLTVYMWTRTA